MTLLRLGDELVVLLIVEQVGVLVVVRRVLAFHEGLVRLGEGLVFGDWRGGGQYGVLCEKDARPTLLRGLPDLKRGISNRSTDDETNERNAP